MTTAQICLAPECAAGDLPTVAALEIVSAPEPGASLLSLAVIASLAFVRWRRRA